MHKNVPNGMNGWERGDTDLSSDRISVVCAERFLKVVRLGHLPLGDVHKDI